MAGFNSLRALSESEQDLGRYHYSTWRKTVTQTVSNAWFDMTLSPGNPSPFYYASAPLSAAQITRSNGGLPHAGTVTPSKQYLRKFLAIDNGLGGLANLILLDYLLYYPFIDESTTDVQALDNSVTLPRYTDGAGVKIMPVVVAAHATGNITFNCTYTNQDGVSGRVTRNAILTNGIFATGALALSSLAANTSCPFMSLQDGDSGVRSIEEITFVSGTDTGLLTLVLVKPLAIIPMNGGTAATSSFYTEIDFMTMAGLTAPEIKDGAYLNMVICTNATITNHFFHGEIQTCWG